MLHQCEARQFYDVIEKLKKNQVRMVGSRNHKKTEFLGIMTFDMAITSQETSTIISYFDYSLVFF